VQDGGFGFLSMLADHNHSRFRYGVVTAVVFHIESRMKSSGNLDTFFDNDAPKLGAFANANARHQNRVIHGCVLFNLNARRQNRPADTSTSMQPRSSSADMVRPTVTGVPRWL